MSDTLRQGIAKRAKRYCEYCQCPEAFSPSPFSLEHISPRTLGGTDVPENLAWSCMGCNGHKGTAVQNTDPISGLLFPLFHPRRQTWTDHFRWSNDGLLVLGITPVGRATVDRLKVNRP